MTRSEWPTKVTGWREALERLSNEKTQIKTTDDLLPLLSELRAIEFDAYVAAHGLTKKALNEPCTVVTGQNLDVGFREAVKSAQDWLEETIRAVGDKVWAIT